MNLDSVSSIAAAIVGVALVTTIVSRAESAKIITSIGSAFSGSITAAMGR